jgi:molybdate transport system substrate-binding protein
MRCHSWATASGHDGAATNGRHESVATNRRRLIAAAAVALAVLGFAVGGCGSSSGQGGSRTNSSADDQLGGTVVVFAAASLKGSFNAIAAAFEQARPGVKVVTSYGGSDTLAAQIVAGAPVDVFASANTATMATVTRAADAGSPQVFAKNVLEIAVPPSNPAHVTSLADVARANVKLALCAPSVPCGAAAAKAFGAANLSPRPVTLEQDVTSVLTKVELGEVDAGLVYRTDVKQAGAKVTGVDFAGASNAVNSYQIAVTNTGKNSTAGKAFADYVLSSAAQQVLRDAGFEKP